MTNHLPHERRIVAFISTDPKSQDERRKGLIRFAERNPHWRLELHYGEFWPSSDTPADGYLIACHLPPSLSELNRSTPLVIIDSYRDTARARNRTRLDIDNRAIGETAARHFLSRRDFRSFVFTYPTTTSANTVWVRERASAFSAALTATGRRCETVPVRKIKALLPRLPRPVAVFAASDMAGFDVLYEARRLRMHVPEDLAVIGVDNDAFACEHAHPALSSLEIDFEGEAYFAAECLERMMNGERLPPTITYETRVTVAARASTAIPDIRQNLVAKALRLAQTDDCGKQSVAKIAGELGISRVLLARRFREAGDSSLRDLLIERRLEKAKQLLRTTSLPIRAIAAEVGCRSAAHLMTVFRRRTGMTMHAYRTANIRPL